MSSVPAGEPADRTAQIEAATLAVAVSRMKADPAGIDNELTQALEQLGLLLLQAGRADDGIRALGEAVERRRRAADDQDAPSLLLALAEGLVRFGEAQEASIHGQGVLDAAYETACTLYRLAAREPEQYADRLAMALDELDRLARQMTGARHPLADSEAAYETRRWVASRRPSAYQPSAAEIDHWAEVRSQDSTAASAATPQPVSDSDDPRLQRHALAGILTVLGQRLFTLGHNEKAALAAWQAVLLHRQLHSEDAGDTVDYAHALNMLGEHLAASGEASEALLLTDEALAMLSSSAESTAEVTVYSRAVAQRRKGTLLSQLGRVAEGSQFTRDALTSIDKMTHPDLALKATVLRDLAAFLHNSGQRDEGMAALEKGIKVHRERPEVRQGGDAIFAAYLDSLVEDLCSRGDNVGALPIASEAVLMWEGLTAAGEAGSETSLLESIRAKAALEHDSGLFEEAAGTSVQGVELLRRSNLRDEDPAQYALDLLNAAAYIGIVQPDEVAAELAADAVEVYQELQRRSPGMHDPEFLHALRTWCVLLGESGQPEDAAQVAEEYVSAVQTRTRDADAHVSALCLWGVWLGEARRIEDALDTYRRAIGVCGSASQQLAPYIWDQIACRLTDLGRTDLAQTARKNAANIRRDNPIEVAAARASAERLGDLGLQCLQQERDQLAATPLEQAMELYRCLDASDPGQYTTDLAMILFNLASCYSVRGRHLDSLHAWSEFIRLMPLLPQTRRGGLQRRPATRPRRGQRRLPTLHRGTATAAVRPNTSAELLHLLGIAHHNLALEFHMVGRDQEALDFSRRSVEFRTEILGLHQPGSDELFLAKRNLARSLANFSARLSEAGRYSEALRRIDESVTIRHEVSTAHAELSPELFISLMTFAKICIEAEERLDDALAAVTKAAHLWRSLPPEQAEQYANEYRYVQDMATRLRAGRHIGAS